jgi:hypothetical protein
MALAVGNVAAARAEPLGDVFEVSPVVTPGLVRVGLALPDGAERLVTAAVEVMNCPDTGGCGEIYPGTFYHACTPVPLAAPDSAGNFFYPFAGDSAPADELPEVMAFYQVQKGLAAAARLGLAGLAEPLHVIVNYRQYDAGTIADCRDGHYDGGAPLEPVDTAYFTTSGQGIGVDRTGFYLVLPQGHAVDLALDGDVVQHELGHAVMATLAPALPFALVDRHGTDPSPGGLHEGFADLLSALVSEDPVIGEYAGSGVGDGSPLRDLGEPARCPDDLTGEPHADSRPFTSGVWAAREAVASGDPARAAAFDHALMATWIALGERAGYGRAAALLTGEVERALGAEAAAAAAAVLAAHGLDGCGGRVVDGAAGKPLAILPAVADPDQGGTAPAIFQLRIELDRPAAEIALEVDLFDTGSPELTRVSALLAAGGEPIAWRLDADGEPASDADLEVPLAVDGDRHARAAFPGPFAAGVYHLMLANHGARALLHGTRARATDAPFDDGGCACRAGGDGPAAPLLVLLLAFSRGAGRGRRPAAARRRS